jgi:hypothetical protein
MFGKGGQLVSLRLTDARTILIAQCLMACLSEAALIQHAGARKWHNFELVTFWQKRAVEALRRVKLIYDPNDNL